MDRRSAGSYACEARRLAMPAMPCPRAPIHAGRGGAIRGTFDRVGAPAVSPFPGLASPSPGHAWLSLDLSADAPSFPDLADIFKGFRLYQHQVQALDLGTNGKNFVVTSGTGPGTSLTYIATIFNHLLANPGSPGASAVVAYPMNALINSQTEEFLRYKKNYEDATGKDFPITFGQYTGQEDENKRAQMREHPPQILLTNYMMLELLLTRAEDRELVRAAQGLRFLVFDELHTYRGRQGADVALLIRRPGVPAAPSGSAPVGPTAGPPPAPGLRHAGHVRAVADAGVVVERGECRDAVGVHRPLSSRRDAADPSEARRHGRLRHQLLSRFRRADQKVPRADRERTRRLAGPARCAVEHAAGVCALRQVGGWRQRDEVARR